MNLFTQLENENRQEPLAQILRPKTLDEYLKKPYRMNIKEDKDEGGYVVFFPELPGCITCGETIESAVKNAEDAKKEWLIAALEEGIKI